MQKEVEKEKAIKKIFDNFSNGYLFNLCGAILHSAFCGTLVMLSLRLFPQEVIKENFTLYFFIVFVLIVFLGALFCLFFDKFMSKVIKTTVKKYSFWIDMFASYVSFLIILIIVLKLDFDRESLQVFFVFTFPTMSSVKAYNHFRKSEKEAIPTAAEPSDRVHNNN
ncbi:hypothetical protein [Enterococcus sp. LJL51]|uniref:hypothetical protein n=1 Tax=Enterococcus sp. LJL51 TaxID=3416656 RepID=UPI003CFA8205